MRVLNYPSAYLALPFALSTLLTFLTFDLPDNYFEGIFFLTIIIAITTILDLFLNRWIPKGRIFDSVSFSGTRQGFVAIGFAGIVILFCILDITLFGSPLLGDPASYTNMEGGRVHYRHVSNMSWILVPIAMLCVRTIFWRRVFITVAFVFPILVLDRNRLFAALYVYIFTAFMIRSTASSLPWKTIIASGFLGILMFSLLGIWRSGSIDVAILPFSPFFIDAPLVVQWVLLYISAGVYNFSAIFAKDYTNATFLINQIVPFVGGVETLGTDIPLDAPTINIGTEFFPFLMAFGPAGVIASVIILYGMVFLSIIALKRGLSIFFILIFFRITYVAVMSPFAPQAYTWTTVSFVFLCLVLWVLANSLPKKNKR